jgi:predicted nucleic acid-binding protein
VTVYFDTGLLIKVYVPEDGSELADELLKNASPPVPFTHLHRIEMRTALRLKQFRGEIDSEALGKTLEMIQADLSAGLFEMPRYDLEAAYDRAEEISARFAAKTGARTLDILHVATALELGLRNFASLDKRQREVAALAGLSVLPRRPATAV